MSRYLVVDPPASREGRYSLMMYPSLEAIRQAGMGSPEDQAVARLPDDGDLVEVPASKWVNGHFVIELPDR